MTHIREILSNGKVRLIGKFIDTRTGNIHYEVICNKRDEKYFKLID